MVHSNIFRNENAQCFQYLRINAAYLLMSILGKGLTLFASVLEGQYEERKEDVKLVKEVNKSVGRESRARQIFYIM